MKSLKNKARMDAIIVFISKDIESIESILNFGIKTYYKCKDEYIYYKKYPQIRIAKDALTLDLLKLNLISEDLQKEVRKGKKRWFSVNGVDVSIRVENELKHMERLCKTFPCF